MGDVRRVEAAVGDVMATSGNRRFLPDPLLLEDEVEEGGEWEGREEEKGKI